MKTLQLKKTEIQTADKKKLTYRDLIEACLDRMPPNGFDYKEMKDRDRISKSLSKAKMKLDLEDSDVEKLKSLVAEMRWTSRHSDILQFCEDVEKL